jgi:hypothetical protein
MFKIIRIGLPKRECIFLNNIVIDPKKIDMSMISDYFTNIKPRIDSKKEKAPHS